MVPALGFLDLDALLLASGAQLMYLSALLEPETLYSAMLNIRFVFDDAITAVDQFVDRLTIPSLPAAVFLMQQDVL